MNNKVNFKRKSPIMKRVFGICFFILGLLALLGGSLFGFIICGLSVFFLYSDGSEIDLHSKSYRTRPLQGVFVISQDFVSFVYGINKAANLSR